MTGISGGQSRFRIKVTLLAVSTTTVAGGVAAVQPALVGGAAAATLVLWCLTAIPALMLAVAVHSGVWSVAPSVAAIGTEVPTLLLIGLNVALLGVRSFRHLLPTSLLRLCLLAALFVLYVAVGAVLGAGLNWTDKLLRLALFIGWGFLLACLIAVDRRATIAALALVVVGSIVIALASAGNWIAFGIPTAFGENRIVFGRSIGLGAVIALGAALTGQLRPGWRALAMVVGLALVVVTLGSASRGAFVSIGAGAIAMFVLPLAGRSMRSRALAVAVLVCLGLVAVTAASGSVGLERLLSLGNPGDDLTVLLRAQVIQYSFDQWLTSPLFGIGLRDLHVFVSVAGFGQVLAYPHNMIVEALSQTGVIGFVLIAATIAVPISTVLRDDRLRHDPVVALLVGGLVFYLVSAQFSGDLQINRYIWTFAFLIAATPAWLARLS